LKVVCKDFEQAIENYSFHVPVTGVIIKIVNVAMLGMAHNVNTTNFTQNIHWQYKVVVENRIKNINHGWLNKNLRNIHTSPLR